MAGILYLIPSPINDSSFDLAIPADVKKRINMINCFIVEDIRTARRYLSKLKIEKKIDDLDFFILNEHTPIHEIPAFIEPIKNGTDIGLLSEAGVPCVADPGSQVVKIAHEHQIQVVPLVGPSSIIMALMASGFNGQNFSFAGYLPINKEQRIKTIKKLEKRSQAEKQTQLFIEAPYRNNQLLNILLQTLLPDTSLCIAAEITSKFEFIQTQTVSEWNKHIPDLNKKPAIFLISRL